jgi:hypothetical protein
MTVRPQDHTRDKEPQPAARRKTFVEPAISSPVDVLEATSFFQATDSGGTGFRKKGGGV